MVHTLKRIYLYTAASFALLFTAGVTINLLIDLFRLAGLHAEYPPAPDPQTVKQDVVFFLVGVVLVGLAFGGVHYWQIRRDLQGDPGAFGGGTRHFFLNLLMAVAALIVLPTGLSVLRNLDQTGNFNDTASPLAFAMVFALVFLLLELERQRAQPVGRAATLMGRIHENGLQVILLAVASYYVFDAITELVKWVLVSSSVVQVDCAYSEVTFSAAGVCPAPSLLGPWAQAIFAVAVWGLYVWLGAWDRRSVLRRIVNYAAFGYGLIWLLFGIETLVQTVLSSPLGVSNTRQFLFDGLPFIGRLLTGLLIATPYFFWLRRAGADTPEHAQASRQGVLAIPAALSLGFLLGGLVGVLSALIEQAVRMPPPTPETWAMSLGFLLAGLGYVPLWLRLRRDSDPATAGPVLPRRAYVLTVLAVTAIAAAAFAVVSAYEFAVVSLGIGSGDYLLARQTLVGAVVIGLAALAHAQQLRADLRARPAKPATQPVPASATAAASTPTMVTLAVATTTPATPTAQANGAGETLEGILRQVAAGALDPATAAAQIRALPAL